MYSGLGATLGFFVTVLVLKFVLDDQWDSDRQLASYLVGGTVLGSILGRMAAIAKHHVR
jgi:hypothetical protein